MRPLSLVRNGWVRRRFGRRPWEGRWGEERESPGVTGVAASERGQSSCPHLRVPQHPCAVCPPLLIPWLWLSSPRSTPARHTALVGSRHRVEARRAGGGLQAPCSRSRLAFSSLVLFSLLGDSGYTEQNSRSDSSVSLPDLK